MWNIVLLQAMREDPPPDARCRDKFLVQSVAISPDREVGNVTAIVSLALTTKDSLADIHEVAECRKDREGTYRREEDSRGFSTSGWYYCYSTA